MRRLAYPCEVRNVSSQQFCIVSAGCMDVHVNMNIQYAILPAVLSTCHVTDVQAQKQVMRKFEKYLAGASPKIKSDPPAPSTPPLWDDISAFLNATNGAAPVGSDVAPEKQQQEGTEERKRKSHLISASPPASPPAPAPSLQDEATPSIDQVIFCWSKLKAYFLMPTLCAGYCTSLLGWNLHL